MERWLENFYANSHRLPKDKYDKRFKRMWEYYLHCGIAAARASDSAVYQVLFMWEYYLHCGIAAARASDSAVYQVLFAKNYTMNLPLIRI